MDSLPRQQGDRIATSLNTCQVIEELVNVFEDVTTGSTFDIDRNQAETRGWCIRNLSWSSDLRDDLAPLISDLPSES